jgi:transposase
MSTPSHPSEPAPEVFVGIDVGKAWLDVAARPGGAPWRVANDEAGVATLGDQLRALGPGLARVVVEATGGVQRAVVATLAAAGLPVVVVNPRAVRDFAKGIGQFAKTDALDAALLAHFAQAVRPALRPLAPAAQAELAALVERRRQLVAMRTAEQNRLHAAVPRVRPQIQAHLARLAEQIAAVDQDQPALGHARRPPDDRARGRPGPGDHPDRRAA